MGTPVGAIERRWRRCRGLEARWPLDFCPGPPQRRRHRRRIRRLSCIAPDTEGPWGLTRRTCRQDRDVGGPGGRDPPNLLRHGMPPSCGSPRSDSAGHDDRHFCGRDREAVEAPPKARTRWPLHFCPWPPQRRHHGRRIPRLSCIAPGVGGGVEGQEQDSRWTSVWGYRSDDVIGVGSARRSCIAPRWDTPVCVRPNGGTGA